MARRRRLTAVPDAASAAIHLPRALRSRVRSVATRLLVALLVLVVVGLIVYLDRDGYRDNSGEMGLLDAFYYATVTLSTTGYGDVVPASDQARLVNVLVITPLRVVFLIILVGTTLEVLTERTREQVRQSRWRSSLHGHTVVVGYGTKGRNAVAVLLDDGTPPGQVVVIDSQQSHVDEATADGLAAVLGDGTRSAVLGRAQVQGAARVVVAVPRDDTAVLVALTARAANPDARLVVSVREAENAPLLRHSGADQVIVSSEAAGRLLGVGALSPPTGELLGDLLEPGRGLELAVRPVRSTEVGHGHGPDGERILAVVRDGRTIAFTDPDCQPLAAGDSLVVVQSAGPS